MNWLAFFVFLGLTLRYIWNGKDFYNKKEWTSFGLKFVIFYMAIFLVALLTKVFLTMIPVVTYSAAKGFLLTLSTSCLAILSAKLLVLLLCFIFSNIMNLHKRYNEKNYAPLSSFARKCSGGLLMLAKSLVSLASVMIFYGLWLA